MSSKSNEAVFSTLEFNTVIDSLSELTVSPIGKEIIERLTFFTDASGLRKELALVTECRDLERFDEPFPLHRFQDLRPQLRRAEAVGAFLQPEEFLSLHQFLTMMRKIKAYLQDRSEKIPQLHKMAKGILPKTELTRAIDGVIDPSGRVKDRASDTLQKLRRQLTKLTSQARGRLETILRTMVANGFAQEDALVLRDGRLVIPMKETHRARLKGLVVDESSSGATLFVEPMEVLELNGEIRHISARERQEVERILRKLTDRVREHLPEIKSMQRIAGKLDALMARAHFSLQLDGNPADIDDHGTIELKSARHPLLVLRENKKDIVPLSMRIGDEKRTLIITGPNAGGKTVALKTVGLLALMHQHGLHIPAQEGSALPLFSRIFADIGDRQSIEEDLSTFSSHIESIIRILDRADGECLVLLDEIGSATDPAEGAALAEVILSELTDRRCMTIATTHMGALKVFAQEAEGIVNGSMAFDQETLTPTYRFQLGIPGSSYAFEIAGRLGLPEKFVRDAEVRIGEDRSKIDRLILHLENELQRTHALLEEAEIKETRLSGLVALYKDRIDAIQKEADSRREKIVHDAEDLLREANTTIEQLVKEIKEKQADRESIKSAKAKLTALKEKVEQLPRKEEEHEKLDLQEGDWVVWKGHSGRGRIVSGVDSHGRVFVQWNGVKLRIPLKELALAASPPKQAVQAGAARIRLETRTTDEIDLRGLTAEEAIQAAEKYLTEARMAGFKTIKIIHGKGTGVLRREISKHVKGHPLVKNQRLGSYYEGDTGVTIVELK